MSVFKVSLRVIKILKILQQKSVHDAIKISPREDRKVIRDIEMVLTEFKLSF